MSTPSGPYDPTPPFGERPQNPPPYPEYPTTPSYAPPSSPYGPPPYGQPVYGQQPYGAPPVYPGYPGYPGYPVPPQTNSNRTLWIVLSVVGGVLVLSCVLCVGVFFWAGSRILGSPLIGSATTLGEFCSYEERQNYQQAYGLFSSNLQNQMTQSQFAQASQNHDTTSGPVTYCSTSASSQGNAPQASDTSASFPVVVTRGSGSTATSANGTITLVKQNGAWKVDSVDQSLGLI